MRREPGHTTSRITIERAVGLSCEIVILALDNELPVAWMAPIEALEETPETTEVS